MLTKRFFPHDDKSGHIKSLDGLRGIAVLIVLLAHSHHFEEIYLGFFQFYGRTGVYLFFILSAYLLDRQIIEVLTSQKSSNKYWINYTIRRVLRIFPLYFFALLVYYLSDKFGVETWINYPGEIIQHLLLIEGKGIFWSIPAEFKYYVISPFLLLITGKLFKWRIYPLLVLILILTFFSYFLFTAGYINNTTTFQSIPAFLIGTLLAYLDKFYPRFYSKSIHSLEIFALLVVVSIHPDILSKIGLNEYQSYLTLLYVSPVLLGVIFLSAKYGIIKRISEYSFLRFIGTISFSIYLFHRLIIYYLLENFSSLPLTIFLYVILSLSFASITYLIIEYPFSKINYNTFVRFGCKINVRLSVNRRLSKEIKKPETSPRRSPSSNGYIIPKQNKNS